MMSPEVDLLGIFVPMPAVAIAVVFVLLFVLRRVLDRFLHIWPLGGRVWHVGLIQVCLFVILLAVVLRIFGGPSALPLSSALDDWLHRLFRP
ncbi:DUF1656 domain-containing protein [Burkholderia sp. 22PA0099]|uniref:DUF1656 domain-containing protein n=1 Tax=Burkholderia sp. 22PA0099 TaxID=3237372 RepID=UPI0039C4C17C